MFQSMQGKAISTFNPTRLNTTLTAMHINKGLSSSHRKATPAFGQDLAKRDNGKENGNYYLGFRVYSLNSLKGGYIGDYIGEYYGNACNQKQTWSIVSAALSPAWLPCP